MSPAPTSYSGLAPVQQSVQHSVQLQRVAAPSFQPAPPDIINAVAPVQSLSTPSTADAAIDTPVQPNGTPPVPINLHDADYAQELVGEAVAPAAPVQEPMVATPLDNHEAFRIATAVAASWSGQDGWSAVATDAEFRTPGQPAWGSRHLGLGFGLLLFTQESGLLGEVLRLYRQRDSEGFASVFGADGDQLVQVVSAVTPAERLAPVGGSLLWEGPWPDRFKAAGTQASCQYAQNEAAVERVVRPAADYALKVGLDTDRAVAAVVDQVVAAGLGRGLTTVASAVTPFATQAELDTAMRAAGYADATAVQAGNGIPRTGVWDAATVAALLAARRAGGGDPSSSDERLARLVSRATGQRRARLRRLQTSTLLDDRVLVLPAA